MQKRAQFYLIAALIIIGVIAGLTAIYNSATPQKENTVVFYLAEEINYEASQILDSAAINDFSPDPKVEELMNYYSQSNPNKDFLLVYGSTIPLNYILYSNKQATIDSQLLSQTGTITPSDFIVEFDGVLVKDFDLTPGRTIFLIVQQEKQGEVFIATKP
jgi:hypothetical protein